jgi:hypothetical protein
MTTTINAHILTIALHFGGNLKVQTALVEGNMDLARALLREYIENSIAEAQYLEGIPDTRLAAWERASIALNNAPGPLLHTSINRVLDIVTD